MKKIGYFNSLCKSFLVISFFCAITAANAQAANFTVNSNLDTNDVTPGNGICADGAGNCTLRAALEEANALAGDDVINFALATPATITLTLGELVISSNITVNGPGAGLLTVSGNNASRVFNIVSGTVNLNNLTVSGAFASSAGGGIRIATSTVTLANLVVTGNTADLASGGGVFLNSGTLTVTDTTISNNTASGNTGGGLLLSPGTTATVLGSTISGNNSANTGGGISNNGTLNIANSTVSGNSTVNDGGGIINFPGAATTLNNVTVTNNTAASNGGISAPGGDVNIRNTIVAQNTAGANPDVFGTFNTLGNNLIGINDGAAVSFPAGTPNLNGDFVGTGGAPLNALLYPLLNNGGPTATHGLITGSPAINNGNNCVLTATCPANNPPVPLTTDQRGGSFLRLVGPNVDIGAFERLAPTASSVAVGGRVLTSSGKPVSRARVTITDAEGNARAALTNNFGYYRFDNVLAGETYVFNIFSKQYDFAPQIVTITEDVTELNFYAEP